jgi:RNA polymerase I-specific transcription initiation factor RRN3
VLCTFLRSHLDAFDSVLQSGAAMPSMAHHSIFYAVSQAIFLIFCFRWRDLEEEPEEGDELLGMSPGKKWMPELEVVQRVVTSPLNPLKVRSSKFPLWTNALTFFSFRYAPQTSSSNLLGSRHATNFVYCYSIMKDNRRSEYNPSSNGRMSQDQKSSVQLSMLADSTHMELNTFFPFDPYRLPRSNSYIQGVYREWSSVAFDDDEDDEDEETTKTFGSMRMVSMSLA